MNRFLNSTFWINRALLFVATGLYALLGRKYLADPVGASAADSISLGSAAGITDMRIVGSLLLACGAVTFTCAILRGRQLDGLRFVFIVLGLVTLTRTYGFLVDGAAPATIFKLRDEIALIPVFGVGLLLELARLRRARSQHATGTAQFPAQIIQEKSREIASY